MADTVAETKETTTVGTPEKNDVEKKVDKGGNGDVLKKKVDVDKSDNGDVLKENGTADEKDSGEDCQDKEEESAEYDDSTDSAQVRVTKRTKNDDVPGKPTAEGNTAVEGASPEKKAKLEEKPAEAEANATNGETEAVA